MDESSAAAAKSHPFEGEVPSIEGCWSGRRRFRPARASSWWEVGSGWRHTYPAYRRSSFAIAFPKDSPRYSWAGDPLWGEGRARQSRRLPRTCRGSNLTDEQARRRTLRRKPPPSTSPALLSPAGVTPTDARSIDRRRESMRRCRRRTWHRGSRECLSAASAGVRDRWRRAVASPTTSA
jgi:hypothetical protein